MHAYRTSYACCCCCCCIRPPTNTTSWAFVRRQWCADDASLNRYGVHFVCSIAAAPPHRSLCHCQDVNNCFVLTQFRSLSQTCGLLEHRWSTNSHLQQMPPVSHPNLLNSGFRNARLYYVTTTTTTCKLQSSARLTFCHPIHSWWCCTLSRHGTSHVATTHCQTDGWTQKYTQSSVVTFSQWCKAART